MRDRAVVTLEEVLAGDLPVRGNLPLEPEAMLERIEVEQLGEECRHFAERGRKGPGVRARIDEHEWPPRVDGGRDEAEAARVEILLAVRPWRRAQLAVETVGPRVVWALQRLALALTVRDGEAAVATDVEERAQLAVARACNNHRNLACPGGEVRPRLRDLRRMADVLPGPREDPVRLAAEERGIRVPAPGECPFHVEGTVVSGQMATTRTRKLPLFEQFMAYRRFSGALAFTRNGEEVLFVSNISGQFNLWRVPIDGGWPDQLTGFVDETVRTVGVSPRDGTIAFCADPNGDEFHQIYLIDPEGGWPEQITDAPEVQHHVGTYAFSPDGSQLAYSANARIPTDMEVWVRDLDSGDVRPVWGEGKFAVAGPWSPDGSKLLGIDFRHNSDTSVFLIDLDSGDTEELTPHEDDILFFPGPWSKDGSGFYLATDEGREFRGLAFYDVESRSYDWLEASDADVDEIAMSEDGRVLAWLQNEDGWERLRLRDLERGADLAEPDMPRGARPHLTGFQPPVALSA